MDKKRIHNDYGWTPSDGDYLPPGRFTEKKNKSARFIEFFTKPIANFRAWFNKKLFA